MVPSSAPTSTASALTPSDRSTWRPSVAGSASTAGTNATVETLRAGVAATVTRPTSCPTATV